MKQIAAIFFFHLWFFAFLGVIGWALLGNFAEKTYQQRMNSVFRSFLMPGIFSNLKFWKWFSKIIALAAIPLALLIYYNGMTALLRK